ncbi:molybdenum cofactor biosynthesis protein [Photobacterium leiognathi]|uniref:molybdenum cofactor biosynthesis protein n=1 Tax=Photobacterium leiognathi TaxID=553611 RepID=UPI0029826691|nr:molybdenum cofactor biosynthesis protein [Photobacterium leiognathi]
MDVKQSWGFISISIGIVSLLWASISLSGIVGQEHVLLEMGSYIHASSTDLSNTNYADKVMAAERHKNFVVLLSGLVMALLGSIMIKGRFNKF